MAVPMASLTKDRKTGDWVARKGIPKDIRDEYQRLYGQRWEALFRAKAGTPQSEARRLFTDWLAETEGRIRALRDAAKGRGRTLTQREAHELAARWYVWFVKRHDRNPTDASLLRDHLAEVDTAWDVMWPEVERPSDMEDLEPVPRLLTAFRALLSDKAQTAQFLVDEGTLLAPEAYDLFLDVLAGEYKPATQAVIRRHSGDFSPDERLQRATNGRALAPAGLTCWGLFEAWVAERKPAAGTVERWRAPFQDLERHFAGRDVTTITPDEAAEWAGQLITAERSGQTVNEIWLRAAGRVFEWAKGKRKIPENPFGGIKVAEQTKAKLREGPYFTDDEVKLILRASLGPQATSLSRYTAAARRWVPWLCAYTGARPGEMTQLRGEDVRQRDGVWSIHITPEAGNVKGSEARTVPVHEHLLEMGFIEFVTAAGAGPLFYDPHGERVKRDDPANPKRGLAKKARERLGEWVRELGVDDPEVRPNHAWRHTFKRRAARYGIEERLCDAFCGHAPASVGRLYMTPTFPDLAEALKRFPRYALD